jgi:capsular polysaccharide biosynthesis protein
MSDRPSTFNLVDVIDVLQKRWKPIALFVLIVLALTAGLLFFVLPKYYKSVAVVIAANPELADKAHLFNNNIQSLYSTFGKEEDLDRIYGIAKLDTVYKQLVDEFNLIQYYKVKGSAFQQQQYAAKKLRDDVNVLKTELYQLRITAYTKERELSSRIVNRMVELIEAIAADTWKQSYQTTLQNINAGKQQVEAAILKLSDSIQHADNTSGRAMLLVSKRTSLLQQYQEYDKAATEYQLAIENRTPALIVLERGYPAAISDRPDKLLVLITAFFTSLAFAVLATLIYERKQER